MKIACGAGLDVLEREPVADVHVMRTLDNVVLTPHQSHNVREFYEVAVNGVVENVEAFVDGKPVRVLAPECTNSLVR